MFAALTHFALLILADRRKKTKEHMAELKTHLLLLQTLGCLVPKLRGVPRTWGNGPSTHWEHQKGHLLSHTGVDDDDSSGHKYIYQEMEYCNRNDLEDFLKAHHTRWESNEANLLVDEKKKIIYQVAFTCCFAMEEHAGFDHKDLKALNIFMHKNPSTGRTGDLRLVVLDTSAEESLPITVLKIPLHSGLTAKLGDFGTSKLDNLGSERAVEDDDFTTIENSPFWFLLRGNKAKTRGKCHDRFALGLLIFHVFYAFCPYQEIFEDDCPKDFKIYATEVLKTSSFEGLRSLTSNTEVYANTLWRQMVLLYDLAFTQDQLREVGGEQWKPVMNKLFSSRPKGLAKSFFDQVELYSIRKGSDPAIERTRRYLKQDGLDLLKELCSHREKCEMTLAEIVFKSAFMSSFHPTESVSEEEGDEAGTTLSFGIFNN